MKPSSTKCEPAGRGLQPRTGHRRRDESDTAPPPSRRAGARARAGDGLAVGAQSSGLRRIAGTRRVPDVLPSGDADRRHRGEPHRIASGTANRRAVAGRPSPSRGCSAGVRRFYLPGWFGVGSALSALDGDAGCHSGSCRASANVGAASLRVEQCGHIAGSRRPRRHARSAALVEDGRIRGTVFDAIAAELG